jgi:polar amino acid transport system substrate-binding protein
MISILFGAPDFIFSAEKLSIVSDEWPPYIYTENLEVKGFDYEIVMAVMEIMNYEVTFKIYPWKRCLYMIKNKQVDAILDIGITEDRKKQMFFPEENISSSASVLFCSRDANFTFNNLEDLKGLKIGTLLGYVYSKEIENTKFFEKFPVQTINQNIDMLKLGRIDMFIANRNAGLFAAREKGVLGKIKYLEKEISGGPLFLAFSKKQNNLEIANIFSEKLKLFKTSKKYQIILRKYGQ